jgi:hypothetical protein
VGLVGDGISSPSIEGLTLYVTHPVELVEDNEDAPTGP